jgi:hypothetical protein
MAHTAKRWMRRYKSHKFRRALKRSDIDIGNMTGRRIYRHLYGAGMNVRKVWSKVAST